MSKIEEALKKVRGTNLVVHRSPAREESPRALAPVPSTEPVSLAQRVNSREEIGRMNSPWKYSENELADSKTIYPEMKDGAVANAFRELRTRVIQKSAGRNNIIMVSSVVRGDGSSFVARNLAVAFTFDESKTALLLDCNLSDPGTYLSRRDRVHHGLTDYLESDGMMVEEIIHPAGIQRLRVIPSGGRREIAAEYFTSSKMRNLIDEIRRRYPERYIVVDAPPISQSADSRILAELCDSILLVVPYGKVTQLQIQTAVKAVGDSKLAGVVFNNEPAIPRLKLALLLPRCISNFIGKFFPAQFALGGK